LPRMSRKPRRAASVDRGTDSVEVRSLQAQQIRDSLVKEIVENLKPPDAPAPIRPKAKPVTPRPTAPALWDSAGRLLNPPPVPAQGSKGVPRRETPLSHMNPRSKELAAKHPKEHSVYATPGPKLPAPSTERRSQSVLSAREFNAFIGRQRGSALKREAAVVKGQVRPQVGSCMTPRSVELVRAASRRASGRTTAAPPPVSSNRMAALDREVKRVEEGGSSRANQAGRGRTPKRKVVPQSRL
jgi:hypothetical protein